MNILKEMKKELLSIRKRIDLYFFSKMLYINGK